MTKKTAKLAAKKKGVKMKPKKKTAGSALNKARSALKKAEHVNTPLSAKRKLASKKEK